MELHELPFAKYIILREDIAEVIINEGVEMDVDMVKQSHEFLLNHLRAPFSLLVNKVNAYAYEFKAQLDIATFKEINAMAVVAYNRTAQTSTEMLATSVLRDTQWNLRIFSNREEGLDWLISEQDKLTDSPD